METLPKFRGRSPVLGIELQAGEARVVHLARQGQELRRLGQLRVPFEAEGAAERGAALRAALDAAGIATRSAVVSLPRHQVILRELELPAGEPDELRSMAELRMERELPFPLEVMAMGLRPLAAGAEPATLRVLAAFIKRDLLGGALALVEAAGLAPLGAGVSALYTIRAFQLSDSFVPGKPQGLVAVGQTMTEIAVLNGTSSLLSRSASTGLVRFEPDEDPESAGNRQFLDEVARTFTSFHGGKEPIRTIYLADHGAAAEQVSRLLARRFEVPVEPLRPFRSARLASSETFEDDHLYPTAFGAAASYLTGSDEIDFLPRARGWFDWLRADRKLLAAVLGLVALLALYVVPPLRFAAMERQINRTDELRKGLVENSRDLRVYRERVEALGPWSGARTPWIEVLERLTERIDNKRAYLTQLQMRDKGLLVLQGQARTSADCTALASALDGDPAFGANLKGTTKSRGKRGGFDVGFTIEVTLAPGVLGRRK